MTAQRQFESVAIAAGGAVGALLRVLLARYAPSGSWPWATLVANLLGATLLAYAVTRLQERLPPSTYRRPFLATGLCGALTTFSTMQIEVVRLARHGRPLLAVSYLAVSVLCGVVLMASVSNLVRRARLAG